MEIIDSQGRRIRKVKDAIFEQNEWKILAFDDVDLERDRKSLKPDTMQLRKESATRKHPSSTVTRL